LRDVLLRYAGQVIAAHQFTVDLLSYALI